ncbi:MAG: hypothetical protein IKX65_07850 [Prevotella sp.]|nr:hypothetical protein [Prevotella sp.]
MKNFFTLLACVLMAGSAFGQKNWKNLVVNGDFEAEAPSYEDYNGMPAEAWNSFWVHEFPKGEVGEEQYKGTVTIVDGVGNNGSRCAKVVARSDEQAIAAGNRVEANGALASWDCQFFIYATEPMPVGKEVRLIMWVKGDKAGTMQTQAHYGPGDYNHYVLFGDVKVTTEWQKVTLEGTVTADQAKESDGKFFQSVAFNLSTDKEGNVFYFDDVKLQMRDPKEDDGSDAGAWINFMRRGIYSMDHIVGKDNSGNAFECTNYTFQDLTKPEGEQQQPAPVVEVPGEPGVYAVHIPVQGYYSEDVPDLDDEGNEQYDEEGNLKMKSVYYWNDGTLVPGINGAAAGSASPARWMCQFFVSTLHKMVPGEKFRFKFRAKADKPTSLGTQCHYGPGQYQSYNTFGDTPDFPIGTDWTTFELGDFESNDASKRTIPSGVAKPTADYGCQTITFDCVPLVGDDNNFYLIVEEFSFTEKYVTVGDRTLGTPEDIGLKVNMDEDEMPNTVDMANMLNTFEVTDFDFLKNPKAGDGIKLYKIIPPDDPEDDPTPSFSGILPWTDGGFVDANGMYIDEENGISIRLDDESIDGSKINVMVWNNPDAGISFENGETVQTKLAISQSGWYYIYNITLSKDGVVDGIKDIQKDQKVGVIYDLMGRKVNKMNKGIYIVNGKKYIVK